MKTRAVFVEGAGFLVRLTDVVGIQYTATGGTIYLSSGGSIPTSKFNAEKVQTILRKEGLIINE